MNKSNFPDLNLSELSSNNQFLSYLNYRKLLKSAKKSRLDSDTWFILSCGPSLSQFENDKEFKDLLSIHPVVTIKQAGKIFEDYSNIHVFNEVRYEKEFNNIGNYRFSVSQFQEKSSPNIHFPIRSYKLKRALFCTNKYVENELRSSYLRPWGVGILFELAIFLPLIFDCKRIVLVGVDMNKKGGYHFYDQQDENKHSNSYNVDEFEFAYTKGTSHYMQYWLDSKGIELLNMSPLSDLPIKKVSTVSELKDIINA